MGKITEQQQWEEDIYLIEKANEEYEKITGKKELEGTGIKDESLEAFVTDPNLILRDVKELCEKHEIDFVGMFNEMGFNKITFKALLVNQPITEQIYVINRELNLLIYKLGVASGISTLNARTLLGDVLPSKEWLEESLVHLQQIEGKLKIHVKLDTGMGRIGTSDLEELKEIDNLLDSEKIDFEGIFSHYSNADGEDDNYDNYQTENFERSLKIFTHKPKYIHIENSAGTVKYSNRDDQYNLTRIGIAMYGCYPSGNIEKLDKVQLEPVASLVSKVTHVKKIQAGQKLGYGVSYEAKQDEYIATVPIGYADGLLRRAQGFKIRVGSEECEIVGRVCMDQLMVRCSKNVKVGDDVLFFGEYSGQKVSVDEFAEYQNTISYEIFCCINKRVPRVYYKNKMEL